MCLSSMEALSNSDQPCGLRGGIYTAAAVLVVSLLCLSCSLFQRYEVKATIPVGGQGNSIVILADTYYDNGRKLFYQVKNDEKVLVDRAFICSQLDEGVERSGFKIVTARGGNLVGIFQESRPEYILLLHDFTSSHTWPGVLSTSESHVETRNRGNVLLASLRQEHPHLKMKLNELECD